MKLLNSFHFVLCGQTSKAATLFAHEENKPFHFMHYWHKLKVKPKWQSICQGSSFQGLHDKAIGSSFGPSVGVDETDSGSAGLTGKRPLGRDSSKSERKKAASTTSTEYLSRLQELTKKQLQHSIEKGDKKDMVKEQDRELENKRLDLEAKKLSIRERELRLQELNKVEEQLAKLERTSEAEVDPEVAYDGGAQKHLHQFIFSFH
jgi:hypothetical protein